MDYCWKRKKGERGKEEAATEISPKPLDATEFSPLLYPPDAAVALFLPVFPFSFLSTAVRVELVTLELFKVDITDQGYSSKRRSWGFG